MLDLFLRGCGRRVTAELLARLGAGRELQALVPGHPGCSSVAALLAAAGLGTKSHGAVCQIVNIADFQAKDDKPLQIATPVA